MKEKGHRLKAGTMLLEACYKYKPFIFSNYQDQWRAATIPRAFALVLFKTKALC